MHLERIKISLRVGQAIREWDNIIVMPNDYENKNVIWNMRCVPSEACGGQRQKKGQAWTTNLPFGCDGRLSLLGLHSLTHNEARTDQSSQHAPNIGNSPSLGLHIEEIHGNIERPIS
ncbi:hypothetical protein ACJX0J_029482, partial [Zea mays]